MEGKGSGRGRGRGKGKEKGREGRLRVPLMTDGWPGVEVAGIMFRGTRLNR